MIGLDSLYTYAVHENPSFAPSNGLATANNLSDRQREILGLLAQGKSNKEIAYDLGISEGTVKQHLFTLFKKIGVTNRTKAVIKAEDLLRQQENGYQSRSSRSSPQANTASQNMGQGPSRRSGEEHASLPKDYAWRMVSAVSIAPKTVSPKTVAAAAKVDVALRGLHAEAKALVDVLDGQLMTLPGGALLAVFGAPRSHLDDAPRAAFLAQKISLWLTQEKSIDAGIGIATAATLVNFSNEPLYRSEAYDLSQDLAVKAAPGQILATAITCKLAGPLFG